MHSISNIVSIKDVVLKLTSQVGPQLLGNRSFYGVFVLSMGCCIFCWYKGFRHTTETDLVLCLLVLIFSIAMQNFVAITLAIVENMTLKYTKRLLLRCIHHF